MTSTADTDTVPTLHLCSDDFAEHERLTAWQELLGCKVQRVEAKPLAETPFHFDRRLYDLPDLLMLVGPVTGAQYCRPKSLTESDDLAFSIRSDSWWISQFGREATLGPGDANLHSHSAVCAATMPASLHSHGAVCGRTVPASNSIWLRIPAAAIAPLVPDLYAVVARRIPAATPALQLLVSYLGLFRNGLGLTTLGLQRLFATHVHDLVAMALGATRDAREIARGRGVRAARLHTIVEEIKQHFADPQFSPAAVAARLRVSPRYVQDLLQETGMPFTDRVTALRLEKARTMLESEANSHRKIIDIAYCCGFNDLSYFNRCFRRRFGAAPTQFRGERVD